MRRALPRGIALLGLALCLESCPSRDAPGKGNPPTPAAMDTSAEAKGPDPRAAFESSNLLGGMSASLESSVILVAASGRPEAGVSLSLGGALSTAAVARKAEGGTEGGSAKAYAHELALASGAKASLPGPALAIASSGERIVVACADPSSSAGGSLLCFRTEGEGERLVVAWKKEGNASSRLIAVPGGRIAVSEDSMAGAGARAYVFDASTGQELWGSAFSAPVADLAYAPGLVLVAYGTALSAYDESTGALAWSASLTAKARALSAGNGVAIVMAETGSLSAFALADGKGVGAAPGPFDAAIRPVADGARAIAAGVNGGAMEIEIKSGRTLRSWAWTGAASFLCADRDRVYAGLDGLAGRGIYFAPRAGEGAGMLLKLAAGAFDSPAVVSGTRGGLLLLLMDGSLVLVGKDMGPNGAASALEAAIAPKPEVAASISAALGRFKPVDGRDPQRYLRFDLFVQGISVDTAMAFTAFRYESASSAKRSFAAQPASTGAVVAIYGDDGRELAASIDELGSVSRATAYLEKGRKYWIAAGWIYQVEPQRFRLFAK